MAWSRRRAAVRSTTWAACALAGLAVAGGVRADPPAAPAPRSIRDQAHAVVDAFDHGDTAEVARLAGEEVPDPWAVADLLCAGEKGDAAAAYARASPRKAVERLPAYVAVRRTMQETDGARTTLVRCATLLSKGEPLGVLRAVDDRLTSQETALSVVLLRQRAEALQRLGRWPEALDAWAVVAERATRLGWWHVVALAANNGGYAAAKIRRPAEAAARLELAVRLGTELDERANTASSLAGLAGVWVTLGDPRRGAEAAERARATARAIHADSTEIVAHCNLCAAQRALGDVVGVVRTAEAWLALARRGTDRGDLAGALLGVANAYREIHDLVRAKALLDETIALVDVRSPAELRLDVTQTAASLALQRGASDEAGALARRALVLAEALGDAEATTLALVTLGMAQRGSGQATEAVATLRAAVERAARGPPRAAVDAEAALANALATAGHIDEAIAMLRKARASTLAAYDERHLVWVEWALATALLDQRADVEALATARSATERALALGAGLPEELLAGARRDATGVAGVGCRAAARLGDAAGLVYFVEAARAGALRDALGGRDVLRTVSVPDALARVEVARRADEAAALERLRAAADAGPTARDDAARAVESARAAVRDIVDRIRTEASAAAAVVHPVPEGLATLQARLEPGEAVVWFALDAASSAVVATPTSARIVALGDRARIDDACDAVAATLPTDADPTDALRSLEELLVSPLALSAATRRVLIVPDGPLATVPLALVLGDREVAMLPSATTYGALRRDATRSGQGVLAIGGPSTQPSSAATPAPRSAPAPLPAAADELRAIGSEVVAGVDATEAEVRRVVGARPRWSAVHFACHGRFDPTRPALSALELASSATDDGLLTVNDVFRLPVAADLVVLAACETGRGRWLEGEGLFGLPRAFMASGAPRVVASLWRVDDRATGALMRAFYDAWKQGLGACASLRAAQAHVRSLPGYAHPRYWAAWTVWGVP